MKLKVLRPRGKSGPAWLQAGPFRVRCALGVRGVIPAGLKREGDGATPAGRWPLRRVFYRPDRLMRPRTGLPAAILRPMDGWCDAPGDRNYNRFIRLPYPASHERLWRGDRLYDVIIVIGHNERPRISRAGSAIFLHSARRGYKPTAGCIALKREDLLRIMRFCGPGSFIEIKP